MAFKSSKSVCKNLADASIFIVAAVNRDVCRVPKRTRNKPQSHVERAFVLTLVYVHWSVHHFIRFHFNDGRFKF
jgi:hypothetical protein